MKHRMSQYSEHCMHVNTLKQTSLYFLSLDQRIKAGIAPGCQRWPLTFRSLCVTVIQIPFDAGNIKLRASSYTLKMLSLKKKAGLLGSFVE